MLLLKPMDRRGDGKRIGVRGRADGRPNKTRKPSVHAVWLKHSFYLKTANGHNNIS